MLRGAGLLDIAHAAMHLDAGRGDLDPLVAAPGFDDRDQQLGAALCLGVALRRIDRRGGEIGERAGRLGAGAHRQQHAPHVGMVDDRRYRAAISRWARHADRLALNAATGIGERGLVGALGDADPLHPDQEAFGVHHREHGFEAAMRLTDAPADRPAILAVGEHAGRRGVDAELLLEPQGVDVVALGRLAVVIEEEFRHQK